MAGRLMLGAGELQAASMYNIMTRRHLTTRTAWFPLLDVQVSGQIQDRQAREFVRPLGTNVPVSMSSFSS